MFSPVRIAPSLLSADFMHFDQGVETIIQGGADWLHLDVMDGHFVPNLTMGVPVLKALRTFTDHFIDVHLMISNPLVQLPWFIEAGADLLCVHVEALNEAQVNEAVDLITAAGRMAAVAIRPSTAIESVYPVLDRLDMVLVMSVEPGFSGQIYKEGTDQRVAQLVAEARSRGLSPLIQVDGGINEHTAALVAAAGADVLVAGNAVFKAQDPAFAIAAIRTSAEQARCQALNTEGR